MNADFASKNVPDDPVPIPQLAQYFVFDVLVAITYHEASESSQYGVVGQRHIARSTSQVNLRVVCRSWVVATNLYCWYSVAYRYS